MYKRCCVIDYVGAIGPKRVVLAGPTTVEAEPGKGGLGDDFLRVMAAVPVQLKDQLLPAAESAVASGETAVLSVDSAAGTVELTLRSEKGTRTSKAKWGVESA